MLAGLKPDLGLLLSVVPETFSYTLCELQQLRVPVLATNIGSFAGSHSGRSDRAAVRAGAGRRPASASRTWPQIATLLLQIHQNLKTLKHRSVEDMLQDYEQLHPTRYSSRKYFDNPKTPQPLPEKNLQLFWRTANSDFLEENSVVVAPLGRERQTARLHLFAPAGPIEQLRLDLSAQPGFFLLHGLSLRDAHDHLLWTWDGDIALLKPVSNQIVFFNSREGDSPALLYFPGTDPYLFPPVPAALLANLTFGSYLEVDFAQASAEDYVTLLISSGPTSAQGDRQLQHLESEVRQRDSKVRELESTIAAVEHSMSWRLTRPARVLIAAGRKMKRAVAHPASPELR